jgi:hypothetical protein
MNDRRLGTSQTLLLEPFRHLGYFVLVFKENILKYRHFSARMENEYGIYVEASIRGFHAGNAYF